MDPTSYNSRSQAQSYNSRSKPHYPQDAAGGIAPSRVSQEGMLAPGAGDSQGYDHDSDHDHEVTPPHRPVQLEETYVAAPPTRPVMEHQNFSYDTYVELEAQNQRLRDNQTPTSAGYDGAMDERVHGNPKFSLQPDIGGASGSAEGGLKGRLKMQSEKVRRKIQAEDKKWQKRLYWIIPLSILAIIVAILFEVYKDDFERWVQPLADWMTKHDAWSWTIPVAILFILSFPPLFGHELVLLIVGLAYPLGVALGISCAGAVLGEAGCFVVFKYRFTDWVQKKIDTKVNWAATARVSQEAGFRGVLVIRYSIVPPHLANPLFACTGMKFWVYMATVVLSLPKNMVFVALGTPSAKDSTKAKWAKVAAIGVVVVVTIFASMWIRKKMAVATKQIERERGIIVEEGVEDQELETFNGPTKPVRVMGGADTSYHGYEGANDERMEYQAYGGPSSGAGGYQNVPNPGASGYEEQDLGSRDGYRRNKFQA